MFISVDKPNTNSNFTNNLNTFMNLKSVAILIFALLPYSLFAQHTNHSKTNESPHTQGLHDHHHNEVGVANSVVYFVKEKAFSYGLHAHYLYSLPGTKFGVGLGYERIFDEHKHNTLGIHASYRPIENLSFNLSPGVTYEGSSKTASFALHFETAYEFEIKNWHMGPAVEFAYDPEDYHISLGLHIGFGF